ncbi:MAG TPA: OmpA family protein [Myxococcota bacterium]
MKAVVLGLVLSTAAFADDRLRTPGEPLPTQPGDFVLKLDGGAAIPLTDPQVDRFDVGAAFNAKALWAITPFLDVGPSLGFLSLPAADGSRHGTALTLGAGVQLKRPHDGPDDGAFFNIAPFLDVDALYVRTGELNRAGFDVGVGALLPIDHNRVFWVGPYARYQQIVQLPARDGFDNSDARTLIVGLALEISPGLRREPERFVDTVPVTPVAAPVETTTGCADRDLDGVPDTVDNCPEVKGTLEFYGCPAYARVVVRPDKLELRERLYFAWNSAELVPASYPVLDEVVQALKDHKAAQVQVEGHTSSEGGDDHNQSLSEARAAAVLRYLVDHGIKTDRLISKGFSSSVPRESNGTAEGRENNRRVEFVVNFIVVNGNN